MREAKIVVEAVDGAVERFQNALDEIAFDAQFILQLLAERDIAFARDVPDETPGNAGPSNPS